jgi:ATP-dependent DNA helicase RecQ
MTDYFDADEEAAVREYLADGGERPEVRDDLHRRLLDAVAAGAPKADPSLDAAVLVRHWLRRLSERDGAPYRARLAPGIETMVQPFRDPVGLSQRGGWWGATPFRPEWLDATIPVDQAVIAGTHKGRSAPTDEPAADPAFGRITRWPTYRSPGQRAAARAVLSIADGATLITMIPTGSGKTEVALCVGSRFRDATTIIVVPTLALTYDFERRFREHYLRLNPRLRRENLRFAWTGDTSPTDREAFRYRLGQASQPLLLTSPESMTSSLQDQLLEVAAMGRLAGLVIDEAHLVTQWGRSFRPEFRTLGRLRSELLAAAARTGRRTPLTLLLSATMSSRCIEDLQVLFGEPGPCELIAANSLRPEPEFWVAAEADDDHVRQDRVLEALSQLPRPAVLYVTRPDQAEHWYSLLRDVGYRRLTQVTGLSRADERRDALAGLRSDGDGPSRYDLVVATSAFGLGIDYQHIRCVLHACIPETVDRWYQEVGRSGRDQHASVALLCPARSDWQVARNLGVTVLRPDTAQKRWADLWQRGTPVARGRALDLLNARGHTSEGTYNLRWNNQLVQGLVELQAISSWPVLVEQARELSCDDGKPHVWFGAELQRPDLDLADWWQQRWAPWQRDEMATNERSEAKMRNVINGSAWVCEEIADEYRPTPSVISTFGHAAMYMEPAAFCGRCPQCRAECVEPRPEEPHHPPQRWRPLKHDVSRLAEFITDIGSGDGLAVIVSPQPRALLARLGQRLFDIGVRHFAGCDVPPGATDPVFHDAQFIAATDLTPWPTVAVLEEGDLTGSTWLNRTARAANRPLAAMTLDILVVADHVTLPRHLITRTGHAAAALLGVTSYGD